MSKRLKEYGISFPATKAWAKGMPSSKRRPAEEILVKRDPMGRRGDLRQMRRALAEIGRDEKCQACGMGPQWNGGPLVLVIDHIDGDWTNCLPENLRYLCPNCHSQTLTYCRKTPR